MTRSTRSTPGCALFSTESRTLPTGMLPWLVRASSKTYSDDEELITLAPLIAGSTDPQVGSWLVPTMPEL